MSKNQDTQSTDNKSQPEDSARQPFGDTPSSTPFSSVKDDSKDLQRKYADSPFGVSSLRTESSTAQSFQSLSAPATPSFSTTQGGSQLAPTTFKQLELRAIFGVEREMSKTEIIQRAHYLPGIRQITVISDADVNTIDALGNLASRLNFATGSVKLFAGSAPVEFIRDGRSMLAIITDGGFAPGVRETLMIVARELGRL